MNKYIYLLFNKIRTKNMHINMIIFMSILTKIACLNFRSLNFPHLETSQEADLAGNSLFQHTNHWNTHFLFFLLGPAIDKQQQKTTTTTVNVTISSFLLHLKCLVDQPQLKPLLREST